MYNAFQLTTLILLTALVVFAFLKNSKVLRIVTIIILQFVIISRDFGIRVYARDVIWNRNTNGTLTEDFKNGINFITDYSFDTMLYLLLALLMILILCIRGFYQANDKQEKIELE